MSQSVEVRLGIIGIVVASLTCIVTACATIAVPFIEDALKDKGEDTIEVIPTALESPTTTNEPTIIPTSTSPSIDTPSTTATSTQMPAATIMLDASGAFPCDAQVDPNAVANRLDVVRQLPNPSATIVGSVNRGQFVKVIDVSQGTNNYYRIQVEGSTLGWIGKEYLMLSESCLE